MDNPTVASIHDHLVNDNDWTEAEFEAFMHANDEHVFWNGNTKLAHDEWELKAQAFIHG